jgi:hypothetical protein
MCLIRNLFPILLLLIKKKGNSISLPVFAFLMFYIFCRVDHDSTKQEFCSCNTQLSEESCDTSINKVGFFYFQDGWMGGRGGGVERKRKDRSLFFL